MAATDSLEIAEQAGIDLALVADNLHLSFDERARQHQSALDLALAIEQAGKEARERFAGPAGQAG